MNRLLALALIPAALIALAEPASAFLPKPPVENCYTYTNPPLKDNRVTISVSGTTQCTSGPVSIHMTACLQKLTSKGYVDVACPSVLFQNSPGNIYAQPVTKSACISGTYKARVASDAVTWSGRRFTSQKFSDPIKIAC